MEHVEADTGRVLRNVEDGEGREGRSTTFAFDHRHILYGKLRPYLNKVALPEFVGRCTTEFIPLLPAKNVSREYLAWFLRRPATVEAAMLHKTGARMPRADMGRVLDLFVDIPDSLEEQLAVVRELDERMKWVARARELCRRQEELLGQLSRQLLTDFTSGGDTHADMQRGTA